MNEPPPQNQNPLLSIWFSPRTTMRRLLASGYDRWNHTLAAVGGISTAEWFPEELRQDSWPFSTTGLLWLAGASLVSCVFLNLFAWACTSTANLVGGQTSFLRTRGALAWSGLVACCYSLVWLALYALVPALPESVQATDAVALLYGLALILYGSAVILAVWQVFATLNCFAEAANLSLGGALGAMILGRGLAVVTLFFPAILGLMVYMAVFMPAS